MIHTDCEVLMDFVIIKGGKNYISHLVTNTLPVFFNSTIFFLLQ